MAAIHDLIAQIRDERLRDRLAAEWARATRGRKFGLVFEEHLPELLPLPKARPRKGDLVAPRGGSLKDLWRVQGLKGGRLQCIRPQAESESLPAATTEFAAAEVTVVREFGEPIFPALVPMDVVGNGGADAPWHTLIEADNYHALQLLEYLYAGQVDCIYIDPPYNTGARDWKYNNDYVDENDGWRHSKWLAFMKRRLVLAKALLSPYASVLIVTIDENELSHLALVLAEVFPDAKYEVDASDADIERLFEEAGRSLSHGLHMGYWHAHAERESTDVKVEVIVVARDHASMSELESRAEAAFNAHYNRRKKAVSKLPETQRLRYDRLRLATAKPAEVLWRLPQSIDWRRKKGDEAWEKHLYVDDAGAFRATLGSWEAGVLTEELTREDLVGWLRNLDRKPWSLEIPYEVGGEIRPMFPDLVVVRREKSSFAIDVLEPHAPSLADNVDKVKGLARFAERHGALFGRIQLIRKLPSAAGGKQFKRLDVNQVTLIQRLLLINSNAQLDAIFSE